MKAELLFIGRIESPFKNLQECPRNVEPDGPASRLVLDPAFADGLLGLEAGQEILVLYWFDGVDRALLRQNSRRTGKYAGTFALRSPHRPNPIGAAVVGSSGSKARR